MNRIYWIVIALAIGCLFAPRLDAADDKPRLNFVFLLVDDWGWSDGGVFGSDLYETPHIDALAARGIRFTDTYAACTVCSPTRAAVMTGQYPARTRVTDWIPGASSKGKPLSPPDWTQKLEHRHTTIAELLKGAGYRTAHIGKWHLTPRTQDADVVKEYEPTKHGFDRNVAGNQWGAPGSYYWPYFRGKGGNPLAARVRNFPEGGEKGDYLTDTLTTECLRIIDDYKADPFYIYFPYYNVHTPIQGRGDLVERYKKKLADGKKRKHTNAAYAAMVTSVDESVGRIAAKLEKLGIADRTVIILTGDNGGLDRRGSPTENAPIRAGKGSAYEGGVRTPGVVYVPGAPGNGKTCAEPIISVDYYPTIAKLARVELPKDHKVDGVSLTPLLRDPSRNLERDAIYWHYPHYHGGGSEPHSAIRAGDWRLVEFQHGPRVELYNLANDPSETTDLAKTTPAKTTQLLKMLHDWRKSVDAQPAVKNK